MSVSTSLRYKVIVAFLALALSSLVNPAFSSELSSKRSKLNSVNSQLSQTRKKIEQAKAQESQLISQIQSIDDSVAAVQKEYDQLDSQLDSVSAQRAETERKLAALQDELWKTEQELDQTEAQLTEQKKIFNNRVQEIYKRGGPGYLDVILNSTDFENLLNRVRFLELIANQDANIVKQIQQTKAAVEEKKRQVEESKIAVNSERMQLVNEESQIKYLTDAKLAQKNALQAEIDKKGSLLSQIKANRAAYEMAEDQLLAESNALVSRIRQLEASLKSGGSAKPASGSTSGFVWPTNGQVTSQFGERMHPILHKKRLHTGVDIGAPYGQSVVAAQGGVVIQAGWLTGYGQTVIISHGGGISTLYGHLSQVNVSYGQNVSKGQVIGHVGSSGLSTGPHLHFEVRRNGTPVDPMGWY